MGFYGILLVFSLKIFEIFKEIGVKQVLGRRSLHPAAVGSALELRTQPCEGSAGPKGCGAGAHGSTLTSPRAFEAS